MVQFIATKIKRTNHFFPPRPPRPPPLFLLLLLLLLLACLPLPFPGDGVAMLLLLLLLLVCFPLPLPFPGDGEAAGTNCIMSTYPGGTGHPESSIPLMAALICDTRGCFAVTTPGRSVLALLFALMLLVLLALSLLDDRSDELGGNRPFDFFCSTRFLLSADFRDWR